MENKTDMTFGCNPPQMGYSTS